MAYRVSVNWFECEVKRKYDEFGKLKPKIEYTEAFWFSLDLTVGFKIETVQKGGFDIWIFICDVIKERAYYVEKFFSQILTDSNRWD